jgi:drug/metabolite transporter (DMT)-like permease
MCVIWGIPYLLIKVAVASISPVTLVFMRTAIGTLILAPLVPRLGGAHGLLRHWKLVLTYTVVEVTIPWATLSHAETKISSSLAGLLVASVPLVGVILAFATKSEERLSKSQVFGLIVGFVGVGLLVGFDLHADDVLAIIEMAIVVVGYSIGPMLISRYMKDAPTLAVITASLLITAVVYSPYALTHLPSAPVPLNVWLAVAGLGVICTALAFVIFFALIREAGPIRATVITYLAPAVAVTVGVAFLHESLTPVIVIAFLLILAGCVQSNRRAKPSPQPV